MRDDAQCCTSKLISNRCLELLLVDTRNFNASPSVNCTQRLRHRRHRLEKAALDRIAGD